MNIVESPHMVVYRQFRFPRSKKKRVRKKWAKRGCNFAVRPDRSCLVMGDTIYCHPSVARALRERVQQEPPRAYGLYQSWAAGMPITHPSDFKFLVNNHA